MSADLNRWPADVHDICGNVFGLALRTARPAIKADARVLEIGCAEFDALKVATKAWPAMTFTGIDWRDTKTMGRETRIKGDVMTAEFRPESFDWIYSISAMEHIGLGHYKADPTFADGDSVAFANAYRWLAPGGWFYFDVPWNLGEPAYGACGLPWKVCPSAYEVVGTSHRVYDDATIASRCLQGLDWSVQWSGKVHCRKTGTLVTQPERLRGGEEFYYGCYWVKKNG